MVKHSLLYLLGNEYGTRKLSKIACKKQKDKLDRNIKKKSTNLEKLYTLMASTWF